MKTKTGAEMAAMGHHPLVLHATALQDMLTTLERQLRLLDWQAIALDALERGNTALADALLGHVRGVEELEAVADAAASVYADGSDADAWTDLFEALSGAGRLPGGEESKTENRES